jgi:hypothetical protein
MSVIPPRCLGRVTMPSSFYQSMSLVGIDQCFPNFFLGGNLKMSLHVPRNPLPMKTHIGQANLIAGSEIKLLLNYCQKFICEVFLCKSAYILKKQFKDFSLFFHII